MRFSSCFCYSKLSRRRKSPCPSISGDAGDASTVKPHVSVALAGEKLSDQIVEVENRGEAEAKDEVFPKSILKKHAGSCQVDVEKGRVKWMDSLGKELVEFREFELLSPPSPHLLDYVSQYQHPHLHQFSPFTLQNPETPSPRVVASISPRETRGSSLLRWLSSPTSLS